MAFGGRYAPTQVDEERAVRLTLAVLDDRFAGFMEVFAECSDDPRNWALVGVVSALAQGLAEEWSKGHDPEEVRELVRFKLITHDLEGSEPSA